MAQTLIPVAQASGIRFSANGRHAYVRNGRDGTATVIALDDLAGDPGLPPATAV